jgi:branched-chain amino acid transport system substrate-binding protein
VIREKVHGTGTILAAAALVVAAVTGCSSSSKASSPSITGAAGSAGGTASTSGATASSSGGTGTSTGQHTITVGVLTDATGVAAASFAGYEKGVRAGIGVEAPKGYTIKYVLADTGSSPAGALSGAQKLVEEDHVFAVLAASAFTFNAAPFLASKGVPVIGAGGDASEWATDKNMFAVLGATDYSHVFTEAAQILKKLGATNLGTVSNPVPSAAGSANSLAAAAKLEGLKMGYINTKFPLGSTDVGPVVLGMKNAGVDGIEPLLATNSSFAIITGLINQDVNIKASLIVEGYGGDLVLGGPNAQREAQGLYFQVGYEPIEMHTAATTSFESALKTYADVAGDPTFGEFYGYASVEALVQGLQAAGANPTQASFINTMLGIDDFNAGGLFGSHSVSFSLAQRGAISGADDCTWITKYVGSTFQLVPGMDPICGQTVPNERVSTS